MELIEIAQLVTGLATLIVASVLIWQMIIQKKKEIDPRRFLYLI